MSKHSHQMVFGRTVDNCPRCAELRAGAKPRTWSNARRDDVALLAEIRAHDCVASRCGPVCTAFQW